VIELHGKKGGYEALRPKARSAAKRPELLAAMEYS